jgi:hypothetical protein
VDAISAQSITSFKGRKPTAVDIDTLERELAKIAAPYKTTLIPGGARHGHLGCIISDEAYAAIITQPGWTLEEPEEPSAYNPGITNAMTDVVRKRRENLWAKLKEDYERYLGVQEGMRILIEGVCGSQHLRAMTDEYVGMANHSVREIIDHLRGRVKLTTADKARMRNEINFEWDQTQDLATYFIELKKIRARLRRWGVEIDDDTLLAAAITQIYKSNHFNTDQLQTWEDLEAEDQVMDNFTEYFLEKYDEMEAPQHRKEHSKEESTPSMNKPMETTK